MSTATYKNWHVLLLYIGIATCLVSAGCRFDWLAKTKTVEPALSPVATEAYAAAVSAYRAGDFSLAAERFDAIREEAADRRLARMALYGLACARFMLAETPEAYIQALELWQGWIDNAPDMVQFEDVRLVDPLLRDKMLFSNIPPRPKKEEEIDSTQEEPMWLFIRTKKELDRLREQLQIAEDTDRKRQKKIRSLEKEIKRLKRQIIALEAIDQKIQEKKTTIPSTE